MRRLKPLLKSISTALIAYVTLAIARLLPGRAARADQKASAHVDTNGSGIRGRLSPLRVAPLVVLLALGATAFAVTADPTQNADATTVGTAAARSIPRATTPSTTTSSTTSSTTTAPPTTPAPTPAPTTAPPTTAAPTTTAPPPPPPTAPQPAAHGACGGSLPPCCVMMRESRGNPTAVNPSSGASGKWQFMTSTWGNYKGYPTAAAAPEYIQDERAAQLWAGGAGAGHWGGGCW